MPLVRSRRALHTLLPCSAILFAACSVTPEGREAKHLKNAKDYLAAKDLRRAAIELKVAAQNMPKDAEPVYRLGLTYMTAGAVQQALEAFQKALKLDPKHEGALYQMALVQVGSNDPEQVARAKAALAPYVAAHPDNVEALGSLALAEAKLGDKSEARRLLNLTLKKDATQIRAAAMIVAFYAATKDVETAKQIARELAADFPNSPEAATMRAQVSLALKDLPDADAQISRALALRPGFQPALELRMRRNLMSGDQNAAEATSQELSRLDIKKEWGSYGRLLFAERRFDDGAAEFDRLLKEHDDAVVLRDEYSGILIAAGRRPQAETVIAGTLVKDPKNATALLQRAALRLDSGDLDQAAKDIQSLQNLKISSAALSYQKSRLAAAKGDPIKQGELLTETLRQNPRLFVARLDLSRVLAGSGQSRSALSILDGASANEKATVDYMFHRNMALVAGGDLAEARKGVDAALSVARSPSFLYQDALVRFRSHDIAGARKSLDTSFQADPLNPNTIELLGTVMKQQGDSQKFLTLVRDAAAKYPQSVVLQDTLAQQLEAGGDREGARKAYESARAAGDVVYADQRLAVLDMQTGAIDAAGRRMQEQIKTHDNAQARMILADIETRKGAPANAIAHYLKAVELEPANSGAMNNLAEALSATPARYDDAIFWAQKALALAPSSPNIQDTVGWICFLQGKYQAAAVYLEKSLRGLDRPVAHYHLAAVLMKTGDPSRARREFATAVKQDPQSKARAAVNPLFN